MIRNRLSVLIAERNLKISRVAKDTGISRSTVTAIAQNDSKMIQIDTIDILCRYLEVAPEDFFEYSPINFDVSIYTNEFKIEDFLINYEITDFKFELFIDIEKGATKQTISLSGGLNKRCFFSIEENDALDLELIYDQIDEEIMFRDVIFESLSKPFKLQFIDRFESAIANEVKRKFAQSLVKMNNISEVDESTLLDKLTKKTLCIEYPPVFSPTL
ncbi:helix-turn-helix transcriptional regulator [Listeria cossartiae subsp. cayugensis]|uniref:Helix-turn-helix transcriptional regulator n=1 Tax=Listeria cossartiae subsp. cayugensis TaxID=2713505 RepID=A0ABU2IIW5_9LIST|nr:MULTISPECIES: helix-turn-helix transcriptional regulator [Listeria]MBC2037944.1 helix-turn-helix transcriptional regulator [Listeria marthii]MDT0064623.1 helix-turn-helix transcriptional regulator [Listeria cossartiae subsp. cayugensis]MDT0079773.1 helix-turn-helix transcriptional regulator [Listeria cossartiae subsp. cayugensis]MDT0082609.1 helix-turn-helix transcriptional regulator [Listeria cossartiae subsp. cayugensis]MDT0086856.1 helix-turn-helix transcriptional regulator [Listeria cos